MSLNTWRAPYSSRPRPSSSPLAILDGGAARGYGAVPQVERAVVVHLCPRGAATWRDQPHLPSRACELSSALAGRAYHAAGQAATALHAMATLQVYQAQALKHLHEGGPDQGAMQELRAATDFALRATNVTARSLGQVMSTAVVQERHLWLTLAQMADSTKLLRDDAPISQGGLAHLEDFAQQFSAVQKQTEAIKHIFPNRDSATTSAGPQPPPARRRGPCAQFLRHQLRPLPMPDWQPDVELAAGERRCLLLRDRPRTPAAELRSVPDAGNPEVEEIVLWGTTTSTSPLPVEVPSQAAVQDFTERVNFLTSGVQPSRVPFLSDASPPQIRTRRSISPAREPGKKSLLDRAQKERWVKTHLDLRALNRSLLRLPFKMLRDLAHANMHLGHQDWFAAIDLKCRGSLFSCRAGPRHRPFLRFAVLEGRTHSDTLQSASIWPVPLSACLL
ncbi:Ribosomal RNA large subunit methyltransferase H [Labeo rohita]|uniref:Ribosomal RNA large subunit methyltransferase H n=1 Tax=Labeo rohita TaxID=84645 RepID=A0ABQ8LWJ8_LABRO|nr:Ribosomal RNA large subunit methyltransferase H [Labeo rohita]